MTGFASETTIVGFAVPVRRSLTEPILLGGAPRAIAILNGTLAGALGLGLRLWLVGLALGIVGRLVAVWAAKRQIGAPSEASARQLQPSLARGQR